MCEFASFQEMKQGKSAVRKERKTMINHGWESLFRDIILDLGMDYDRGKFVDKDRKN